MVKFAKNKIIGTLGSGGFGDVYKTKHTETGKIFALKKAKEAGKRLWAWVNEINAMRI